MRDRLLKPAIDHRRLGQFLTGDWVKNIPALTNFLIYDKGRVISSIRFSFMIPAFPEVLTLKDFSKQPQTYRDLLNAEIKYCNQKVDKIYKKAKQVYKIGTNRSHPLSYTCCDFKLLEEKSLKYLLEITKSQVAATDEDQTP